MAKKKKLSSSIRKPMIAAPCGDETTMFLDQLVESNAHTGDDVVEADTPSTTPGISVDIEAADARRESEPNESMISPYAYSPVAIDVGPGLATYWVPKHLLRSPKWSNTDAGGTVCLTGVSAATGHTLVHYLYTGTYQALEAKGEDAMTSARIKFKQALLTFVLASAYELQDLERLAKKQIEIYGSRMALVEVLNIVKEEFSKLAWSWLHEYLQTRANEQFDLDHTFFISRAYVKSVGEGKLHRFMTCHLLELFSEKLTHTLQRRESRCLGGDEPDALSNDVEDAALKAHCCHCNHREHQTGMCTASDDMSLEFLNVLHEEVDDVISLENSVCDGTPSMPPIPEPVPPPEPKPPVESKPEPDPASSPAKEEAEMNRIDRGAATYTVEAETGCIRLEKEKAVTCSVEQETVLVSGELEPEPAADPDTFHPDQEYKPEPKPLPEETIHETSSTLCPRRSQHLFQSDRWRSCERCRSMLGEIVVQLAKENNAVS